VAQQELPAGTALALVVLVLVVVASCFVR